MIHLSEDAIAERANFSIALPHGSKWIIHLQRRAGVTRCRPTALIAVIGRHRQASKSKVASSAQGKTTSSPLRQHRFLFANGKLSEWFQASAKKKIRQCIFKQHQQALHFDLSDGL